MNNVLNNLNALNRSMEGVVAVGKEFESISGLWNNYYNGLVRVEEMQKQYQTAAQTQNDEALDSQDENNSVKATQK